MTDIHVQAMGAPTDMVRCPLMPNYGAPSIMFVRGRGTELWDRDGKRYLDFVGGLAVQALGHAHPEVTATIAEQAAKLVQVSNLCATEHAHHVAATLDRHLGGGGQVFFCNSGAEANEFAFKLARKWAGHGRHGVITTCGSFHGRTLAALAASGQPKKHEPFEPMPEGFRHVARDDVDALEGAIDPSVAAIQLEPVQGEGGVWPNSPEYLHAARRLSDERGLLLMLDEVQSGLCRTGRVVRGPALRGPPRRRVHGQGARQRVAHRGGVGPRRGGVLPGRRRSRHHLRRPSARYRRGPHGPRDHGTRRSRSRGSLAR